MVVGEVDGDLGQVGLVQVPADGLAAAQPAGLPRTAAALTDVQRDSETGTNGRRQYVDMFVVPYILLSRTRIYTPAQQMPTNCTKSKRTYG